MALREQDKHFLSSLFSAVAIIFVWKGLWEGLYYVPFLGDLSCPDYAIFANVETCTPFVFLFIGFAMLTFSGTIFKEFDPLGSIEKAITEKIKEVAELKNSNDYIIIYEDKHNDKVKKLSASKIYRVDKKAIIYKENQQEVFIPLHRIKEIVRKGEKVWRA